MTPLPRASGLDSTVALWRDPYRFISARARRLETDAFVTRLALRPLICLTGVAGARLFYDSERFWRQGAMPEPVQATLFGRGGVQMLDGDAHRHRKALFMSVLSDDSVRRLGSLAERSWEKAADGWRSRSRVQLYDEAKQIHCRAVSEWAGVPLLEVDVVRTARDLALLFEGVAKPGPAHLAARLARRRLERWLSTLVRAVREGRIHAEGTPLEAFASHRDLDGRLLPARVAAVDLLSLLRPTTAGAVFIVFVALALHDNPDWRERLADPVSIGLEPFVQEVRRMYPFAPFVAARVRRDFTWSGFDFPAGRLTLLDLYGINHDPRVWVDPDAFDPSRFEDRLLDPNEFVPQGGGNEVATTHRCVGELATVQLMKVAGRFLARLRYAVPEQDLRVRWSSMPALPSSHFIMARVRHSS